nr:hypothetical protein [Maledivibacter halophilus]
MLLIAIVVAIQPMREENEIPTCPFEIVRTCLIIKSDIIAAAT